MVDREAHLLAQLNGPRRVDAEVERGDATSHFGQNRITGDAGHNNREPMRAGIDGIREVADGEGRGLVPEVALGIRGQPVVLVTFEAAQMDKGIIDRGIVRVATSRFGVAAEVAGDGDLFILVADRERRS